MQAEKSCKRYYRLSPSYDARILCGRIRFDDWTRTHFLMPYPQLDMCNRLPQVGLAVVVILVVSGVGAVQTGASPATGENGAVTNLDVTEQSLSPVAT